MYDLSSYLMGSRQSMLSSVRKRFLRITQASWMLILVDKSILLQLLLLSSTTYLASFVTEGSSPMTLWHFFRLVIISCKVIKSESDSLCLTRILFLMNHSEEVCVLRRWREIFLTILHIYSVRTTLILRKICVCVSLFSVFLFSVCFFLFCSSASRDLYFRFHSSNYLLRALIFCSHLLLIA